MPVPAKKAMSPYGPRPARAGRVQRLQESPQGLADRIRASALWAVDHGRSDHPRRAGSPLQSASAACGATRGSTTVKRAPFPVLLSTLIRPPRLRCTRL